MSDCFGLKVEILRFRIWDEELTGFRISAAGSKFRVPSLGRSVLGVCGLVLVGIYVDPSFCSSCLGFTGPRF